MALDSLQKICQDHANRLIDQPILNLLIPKLISFHTSATIQFRVFALSAISQFHPSQITIITAKHGHIYSIFIYRTN